MNGSKNSDTGRKAADMPPQYVAGEAVFLGKRIKLTPDVFIPRPETETLVQKAVDILSKMPAAEPRVLDLCTGSGAVAISLASAVGTAELTGVDISEDALRVAEENIKANFLSDRIKLVRSDLYRSLERGFFKDFDMIVANPPYVSDDGYKYFTDEWSRKEPELALRGGNDGMDIIRSIIAGAKGHLVPFGCLVMEIGFDQASSVKKLMDRAGFSKIRSCYDLNGFERVIWGSFDG